ncbi:hypothetical protein SAMN05518672_11426 [Chitinophaga sp. CF118]|uniref:hypothetical protein n=1 Tax=Chitinophaga sp. CF118 TaxID=1884367 RepID=UPI0008E694A4|nr:hypothetical protein [Chitinophaga sp. CF118]SFF00833.1 hypothetical protein SAMN05518672_11426 [Chitinophaga sp. CF118]
MTQQHSNQETNKNEQHKRAFIVWLAIFPLITILLCLLGDILLPLPLILRTFILTIIVVPTMVYFLVPLYTKLFSSWFNK